MTRKNQVRAISLIVPALILSAAVIWGLGQSDHLPMAVASHFTFSGEPDGFMPVDRFLLTTPLVGSIAIVPVALLLPHRLVAAINTWLASFLACTIVFVVEAHLDIGDPVLVRFPVSNAVAAAALAVLPAIAVWFLTPHVPNPTSKQVTNHTDIAITETGSTVWLGSARAGGVLSGVMATSIFTSLVLTAWAWLDGAGATVVIVLSLLTLLLVFLALIFSKTTVRVDATGLSVRYGATPLGSHFPATTLTDATAVQMGFDEWLGFGYRMKKNASAVHLRDGDGLRVSRRGKRDFFVNCDDAEKGARLLRSYIKKNRGDTH